MWKLKVIQIEEKTSNHKMLFATSWIIKRGDKIAFCLTIPDIGTSECDITETSISMFLELPVLKG